MEGFLIEAFETSLLLGLSEEEQQKLSKNCDWNEPFLPRRITHGFKQGNTQTFLIAKKPLLHYKLGFYASGRIEEYLECRKWCLCIDTVVIFVIVCCRGLSTGEMVHCLQLL
jgi:hypothetical protein